MPAVCILSPGKDQPPDQEPPENLTGLNGLPLEEPLPISEALAQVLLENVYGTAQAGRILSEFGELRETWSRNE